jgi:predicted adenylyl cyclase CyaB
MPFREYEAKVLVKNTQKLSEKLHELGATLLKRALQRDCYYDLNYRLAKKDQLLRIRIEEDIDNKHFSLGEFSWKSGRKGENYEVRKDISIPLSSLKSVSTLERLIEKLGFRKLVSLIKHRERWRLDEVEFEFDKNITAQAINRPLREIGSYLQATIETEIDLDATIEQLLWTALENLGFGKSQSIKESYIELYLQDLKKFETTHASQNREI